MCFALVLGSRFILGIGEQIGGLGDFFLGIFILVEALRLSLLIICVVA